MPNILETVRVLGGMVGRGSGGRLGRFTIRGEEVLRGGAASSIRFRTKTPQTGKLSMMLPSSHLSVSQRAF